MSRQKTCPECGERLLPTDHTCMACGHDVLGQRAAEQRAKEEAEREEAQRQRQAAIAAAQAQEDAARRALYAVNTGLGRCPQCGSPNIVTFQHQTADGEAQAAFACCACACIAWPLALLAPFLFRRHDTWRSCRYCSHKWPA